MRQVFQALVAGIATVVGTSAGAGNAVYKCSSDSGITYQSHPCSSGAAQPAPTVQQLNAERQRRLREQAAAPPTAAPPLRVSTDQVRPDQVPRRPVGAPGAAAAAPSAGHFRCDGRTRCTQMTSCAEATFFQAHCPGAQMDGNHDGVPCEVQWCNGGGSEDGRQHGRRGRH